MERDQIAQLDGAASPAPWKVTRDGGTAVIRTADGRELHLTHRGDGLRDEDLRAIEVGRQLVHEQAVAVADLAPERPPVDHPPVERTPEPEAPRQVRRSAGVPEGAPPPAGKGKETGRRKRA